MGANPQLARLNDQVMIEYLAKLNKDDIIDRVTAAVVDMLPSGGVADEKIAESLNMSVRSLQRRLREEGTSFQKGNKSIWTTMKGSGHSQSVHAA